MRPIRAAFDLGSSQHKLTLARHTTPPQILFETAISVPLADALTPSKTLPASVLRASHAAVQALKAIAESHGATSFAAVATQVFRVAANGPAHLHALAACHGIRPVVLTPSQEGELGFRTAICELPNLASRAVVWDSGGGSTQWTAANDGCCVVHGVPVGSRDARAAMRRAVRYPNVVAQLTTWVHRAVYDPPDWLRTRVRGSTVVGIGGRRSMFYLAARHVGREVFGRADVCDVVQRLDRMGPDAGDEYWSVLPKLVLLMELMRLCGIEKVQHLEVNGSCLGLLATDDERYWESVQDVLVSAMPREEHLFSGVVRKSSATTPC